MRKVLFTTLLGIALAITGCKKENKDAATGSAAPAAGSAAPAAAGGEAKTAEPTAPAADPTAVAPGEPAPAAAADPGPRPASLTDEDIALADKLVAAIEKMANGINAAGTDCPKVAEAIKSMSGEMTAIAEQGKKLNEKMESDEAAKKWFEATYAPKVMGTMGKVMNNTCFADKAVQDAMSSIKMP